MSAGMASGELSRWTRYFAVASALSLVGAEALDVAGTRGTLVVTVALFGFVCPMIFGMAYLLVPSFVGRTLTDYRLPGLHFGLAYLGTGSLVLGRIAGVDPLVRLGVVLWSLGVVLFVGLLAWTTVPAVRERPAVVLRTGDRPQRSTRLATGTIPVTVGYLVVGTAGLLGWAGLGPFPRVTFPAVVHYYGAGLGALLIFALGARLMPGFFHVTPPRAGTWLALVPGAVAPGLLATSLWTGVGFRAGAILQATAMAGYAGLVGYVFRRSEWQRVGLYGILLGAVVGVVGVGINVPIAFDIVGPGQLDAHATVIVSGFFALTIVGYAMQFFAVTGGQFPGATKRTVLGTILTLALGTLLDAGGSLGGSPLLSGGGAVLTFCGAVAYAYLLGRRLLFE
ncbi:MAG: hypothetical protein ABEJ94_07745 [Halorientalis sp.]